MVFAWCPLGYKTVPANKADCRHSQWVSWWACCFRTLPVQKVSSSVSLCPSLREGCFSGVLNWKRAPLTRGGGIDWCRSGFFAGVRYFSLLTPGFLRARKVWRALPLADRGLSIQRFLCLLIFTEEHILFSLPLLVLCGWLPALQLRRSRGWLSPGEVVNCVVSTDSCSISPSRRLRANVKLVF